MSSDFYEQYLKAFPASQSVLDHEDVPFFSALPELLHSAKTAGINLRFVRAGGAIPDDDARFPRFSVQNHLGGKTPGHLVLCQSPTSESVSTVSREQQEGFARALAGLLADAYTWQSRVRQQEASRTSDIPVLCQVRDEETFAELLRKQLKHAAKLVHCSAASLYLLNTESSELHLRASWGLPEERFLDPPRTIYEAYADMEAMLGQAVLLTEEFIMETWTPPESFPAAVCVPLQSDETTYGTVWFFSDKERSFSEHELSVLELATGRITAEIEKAALIKEIKGISRSRTSST
ncbi:MAG: GAF domain-containing protein [Thermoguttaceae bacterium]